MRIAESCPSLGAGWAATFSFPNSILWRSFALPVATTYPRRLYICKRLIYLLHGEVRTASAFVFRIHASFHLLLCVYRER